MTLKKILNELLSVEQIPGNLTKIFWKNGKVAFDTTDIEMLFDSIIFQVNKESKELYYYTMDDWSEIRSIKHIQQALKDLIRAKIIDLTWIVTIESKKNTIRSLNSNKVKDIIKIDTSFSSKIPFCFHGTSTEYLPHILKNGIVARKNSKTKPNWEKGYISVSQNNIYLTIDYQRAFYYAQKTVTANKQQGIISKPVVIMIKDLDSKFAITDDDYFTHGNLSLLQFLRTGKKAKDSFVQGIRNTSQFAYSKSIPVNKIYKVFKRH